MASEKQPPAGAAIILIDDLSLHAILNLPDDIQIHHSFVPGAHWGQSLAIMVVTDVPGRLPPIKPLEASPYLDCAVHAEMHEGKQYFRVEPILPEKAGE